MLYQQGTQRIEVIVRKEGGGGADGAGTKETAADETTGTGSAKEVGTGKGIFGRFNTRAFWRTNITHGLATGRQVGELIINYKVGGLGLQNGDQALQDQIARKIEQVKDPLSFATSIAMGASYGSAGGVPGAIFGALFGALGTGASLHVKYLARQREYDYTVFKEQNAIEYQRARAGIDLTNGRLR